MICPNKNCRQVTDREVTKVDKHGKARTGCWACFDRAPLEHAYTGKKIWSGEAAYGVEKNKEKNYEYGQKLIANAATQRRRNAYDDTLLKRAREANA